MIHTALMIAAEFNIRKKDEKDLLRNGHITNKNIDLDKWKTIFNNPELIQKFRRIYPVDIFDKIGYPVDNLDLLHSD
jgi:hypothetical protein